MALPIFQVDYSPVYNALNTLRGGKRIRLAEQERKLELGLGILEGGLRAAELIYGAVAEAKLAQAKKEIAAFDQEAQQKARDAISNNDYEWVDDAGVPQDMEPGFAEDVTAGPRRNLKLGGDFESWYSKQQQEIEDRYKGFPEIRSWAFDQMYASYDTAKRVATDTLFKKAMQDTAAIDQQNITNSVDQAIRHEDFNLVDAAIGGTHSLSPDVKKALREDLFRQYSLGIQGKRLREKVGAEGYAAGMDLVSSWESSGQVGAEQAENFRKMALGASAEVAATFQTKATDQFYQATANGQDPEAAMQSSLQAVPQPYRGQVEKLVRADYEARMRIENDKADKEMLIINNEQPQNGAALLKALYNPENHYARRMDTSTYTFWENYGNRLMAAAGRDSSEGDGTTQAGQAALDDIIREPWMTKPQKIKAIQRAGELKAKDPATGELQYIIGPATLNKYLNYANSDVYYKPEVVDAWGRINKFFDALEKKNDRNMTRTRQQVLEDFGKELNAVYQATKQPKATDIEDIADRLLNPHKSAMLPIDQVGELGRRTRAAQLLRRSEEISLNPEERSSLAEYLRLSLGELYGVGEGGTQIAGMAPDERGRPIFSIAGLNPADPKTPYTYRFGLDERSNLRLEGEDSTGHWIPVPIKSKEQIAGEVREQKRQESRAKDEEIRRAAGRVKTIAEVEQEARRLGTSPERLGFAAVAEEVTTSPGAILERLQTLLPRQFRTRQATAADVREAAKRAGISEAAAYGMLLNQGIRILQ